MGEGVSALAQRMWVEVLRGGSWFDDARMVRCARFDRQRRHTFDVVCRDCLTGLRPVAEVKEDVRIPMRRGGSWFDGIGICHSAYRGPGAPGIRSDCLGFRPVAEVRR